MKTVIMKHLVKLNGPQHHKGFLYIVEAVEMLVNDYCKPIGEIYDDIAKKYKDHYHSVSRNISFFLSITYEKGCQEELKNLHCSISEKTNLPVNKEFLRALTNKILIEENLSPKTA